jgi:hypothetical protein
MSTTPYRTKTLQKLALKLVLDVEMLGSSSLAAVADRAVVPIFTTQPKSSLTSWNAA